MVRQLPESHHSRSDDEEYFFLRRAHQSRTGRSDEARTVAEVAAFLTCVRFHHPVPIDTTHPFAYRAPDRPMAGCCTDRDACRHPCVFTIHVCHARLGVRWSLHEVMLALKVRRIISRVFGRTPSRMCGPSSRLWSCGHWRQRTTRHFDPRRIKIEEDHRARNQMLLCRSNDAQKTQHVLLALRVEVLLKRSMPS
jgi:hypothetical protein